MNIDYASVVDLLVLVINKALPIGILFYLSETLVSMFLRFAFPKKFRD